MTSGILAETLSHRYGDHLAVDGVSFEVTAGQVFGLLGPNGAGKTTLLRMLAGILKPSAGRAWLAGFDTWTHPLEAKAELGFLSGDTALYQRLTARECLRYFGTLHGMLKPVLEARLGAVSEEFGLYDFLDQRAGTLSSGQRQRANLARAFLSDPAVLILDEPSVGLDVISGHFVIEAIARAKAAGKAILFSTHIMSEVEALCDRVGILLGGRLIDTGAHDDLLQTHEVPTMSALIRKLHEERAAR